VPCHKSDSVSCVSRIPECDHAQVLTRNVMGCQPVLDDGQKTLLTTRFFKV